MRRLPPLRIALVGAAVLLLVVAPAYGDDGLADEAFWRINDAREERGLAALARFPDRSQVEIANDDYTRTERAHRISQRNMDHYADLGATGYGENQGMGATGFTPRRVVAAWMGSATHAENLFSETATHLAVAAARTSATTTYTAHVITAPSVDTSDLGPQPSAPSRPEATTQTEPPGQTATETQPGGENGTGGTGLDRTDDADDGAGAPQPVDPQLLEPLDQLDMSAGERDTAGTTARSHGTEADEAAPPSAPRPSTTTPTDTVSEGTGSGWLVTSVAVLVTVGIASGLATGHRRRRRRLRRGPPPRSRTPRGRSRHAVRSQLVAPDYRPPLARSELDGGPPGDEPTAPRARSVVDDPRSPDALDS